MTPHEAAAQAHALRKQGLSIASIAEQLGCSVSTVENRLAVTRLIPDARRYLDTEHLSGVALATLARQSPAVQKLIVAEVRRSKMRAVTIQWMTQMVRQIKAAQKGYVPPEAPRDSTTSSPKAATGPPPIDEFDPEVLAQKIAEMTREIQLLDRQLALRRTGLEFIGQVQRLLESQQRLEILVNGELDHVYLPDVVRWRMTLEHALEIVKLVEMRQQSYYGTHGAFDSLDIIVEPTPQPNVKGGPS